MKNETFKSKPKSVVYWLLFASQIAISSQANAAPAPSAPAPSPSVSQESVDGEFQPMFKYVSPNGHVVHAYDAIRSPVYCTSVFNANVGETYKMQYRIWTNCILGSRISR